MKQREHPIGYYIKNIHYGLNHTMDSLLKEYDLTYSQFDIIRVLYTNQNRPMCQKDLQECLCISNPTVTGLLDRLEQKGYVERIPSDQDKRIRYVTLTSKTKTLDQTVFQHIDKMDAVMLKGMNQQQQDELFKLLDHIYENLREEEIHVKNLVK